MQKTLFSIVASTLLIGSLSDINATSCPSPALVDGGSSSADSLSDCGSSTIDSGQIHTFMGDNLTFSKNVIGASDGVGQIIIGGNLNLGDKNLGTSNQSLDNLTINAGKTLTLNGTGDIDASSISLGGTLDIFYGGAAVIGTIDGSSNDQGVLDVNSYFSTGGVIGGTNKLSSINVGNYFSLIAGHSISSTAISLNNGSTLSFYGDDITIESNVISDNSYDNSVVVNSNSTFKGRIGTSTTRLGNMSIASGKTLILAGDVFSDPIYTNSFSFYGGGLVIDPRDSAIADGSTVTIVDSTNIISSGTVAITDTSMIDYTTTINDNTVVVSASYKGASSLGLIGESASIYSNASSAIGSNDGITSVLNRATTSEERATILKSIRPDGSFGATIGGINLSNSTGATVSNHVALLRQNGSDTGIATGDQLDGMNMWVQVYENDIKQDARNGISGYDADGYGLVLGSDKIINDDTTFGLAFSVGNSKVTSKSDYSTKTDTESYQLSAYLSKELSNNYFVEGIVAYAKNSNDSMRNIAGGSISSANFDSNIYQLQMSVGKTIDLGDYKIIPKGKLSYFKVETDNYSETGAGGLNLMVDTDSFEKIEAYIGTVFTRTQKLASGAEFVPELRAGITREFGDDALTMNSTFQAGGTFSTTGLESAKTSVDLGFGLGYISINKMTELRVDYDFSGKEDYREHSGMLTCKFKF